MEIHKIENVDREFLSTLKMRNFKMLSEAELDFLTEHSTCRVIEFTQENGNETDAEFYQHFVSWLQEEPIKGYVYYYLIMGMRKGENLTDDEFQYLETHVTPCFDTGYGWIAQTNNERRFKRRIKLITFEKHNSFRRLIPLNQQ